MLVKEMGWPFSKLLFGLIETLVNISSCYMVGEYSLQRAPGCSRLQFSFGGQWRIQFGGTGALAPTPGKKGYKDSKDNCNFKIKKSRDPTPGGKKEEDCNHNCIFLCFAQGGGGGCHYPPPRLDPPCQWQLSE